MGKRSKIKRAITKDPQKWFSQFRREGVIHAWAVNFVNGVPTPAYGKRYRRLVEHQLRSLGYNVTKL